MLKINDENKFKMFLLLPNYYLSNNSDYLGKKIKVYKFYSNNRLKIRFAVKIAIIITLYSQPKLSKSLLCIIALHLYYYNKKNIK